MQQNSKDLTFEEEQYLKWFTKICEIHLKGKYTRSLNT